MTKKKEEKIYCIKCQKEKDRNTFYNSHSTTLSNTGKMIVCKNCFQKMIDIDDIKSVHNVFQQLDICFEVLHWDKAMESKRSPLGSYITMVNSLPQFKGTAWKDSVFERPDETPHEKEETTNIASVDKDKPVFPKSDFKLTKKIIDRWGIGYATEEYEQFEKKYTDLVKNYGEKTSFHVEGLRTYIRYRVKEEMATARGAVKEAKDWGGLASVAAKDAKINVSQLSKSDISGGVDVLSQLFEAVETKVGIIPHLPSLQEQPYDDADMIIWSIINYYRELEGKPRVKYKDVWNFYDEMLGEHFDQEGFSKEEIEEFKSRRENVFRDLEEVYNEPLYNEVDN